MYFINHGESDCAESFAATLKGRLGVETYAPFSGTSFDIAAGEFIEKASPVVIEKRRSSEGRVNTVYQRLLAALDRLTRLIKGGEGRSNKELAKLADNINDMCNKFE